MRRGGGDGGQVEKVACLLRVGLLTWGLNED